MIFNNIIFCPLNKHTRQFGHETTHLHDFTVAISYGGMFLMRHYKSSNVFFRCWSSFSLFLYRKYIVTDWAMPPRLLGGEANVTQNRA